MTDVVKADTPPKPQAAPKIKLPTDDWAMPERNEQGQQIDEHGFPLGLAARAQAIALAGRKTDPAELVTPEQIEAANPKPAAADREAIAQAIQDKADAAATKEG